LVSSKGGIIGRQRRRWGRQDQEGKVKSPCEKGRGGEPFTLKRGCHRRVEASFEGRGGGGVSLYLSGKRARAQKLEENRRKKKKEVASFSTPHNGKTRLSLRAADSWPFLGGEKERKGNTLFLFEERKALQTTPSAL